MCVNILYNMALITLRQEIMNIDNFIQSELRVIASEKLDISNDLEIKQTKNISELLINEEKKEENNQKSEKNN